MLQEFKQFLLRGNVVDLAVAVVVGAAFSGVVNSLVKDLITPLIAAIGGQHDFSKYSFTIHHSTFQYGDFLNQLISFALISTVIFFFVVKPINQLVSLSRRGVTPDPTTRKCPECMAEIPINATRCMFCTQEVKPDKPKQK